MTLSNRRDTTWQNEYSLDWFELMLFHETKYVIYGVGQWSSHIMDWRGMNMRRGRLPESPVFKSIREAVVWLYEAVKAGKYKDGDLLAGSFYGENYDREVGTLWFADFHETFSKYERAKNEKARKHLYPLKKVMKALEARIRYPFDEEKEAN